MNAKITLVIFLIISFFSFGQDFSDERFLTVTSKDSIDHRPRLKSSVGVNMKLNGFYDSFGGLQDSETFNIGLINVFDDNDEGAFHMDMYQTQIRLESTYVEKGGEEVYAMVEFDFWGGNGRMRLRKAYIE